MDDQTKIIIAFGLYLACMMGVGVYFFFRSRNISDYYLGGRKLNKWVTAISAQASDMSGWLLMGLPGAAYAAGLVDSLWIAVGLGIGTWANWRFVAARLRHYTHMVGDSITIPDFFENRFQDKSRALRIISALVILVFFLFYVASGFVAGAKLFNTIFGIDYQTALLIGAGVIIVYTFLGGFMAVCWTDLFQGMLMFIAILIVPVAAMQSLGGIEAVSEKLKSLGLELFHPFINSQSGKSITATQLISNLGWGLGYFGMPHILVRFMAINSPGEIRRARLIAVLWVFFALGAALLVGIIGRAYMPHLADGERIFMTLVQSVFPAFLAGILLSAILAAVMSTADSQLLVAASALSGDFYRSIFRPKASDKELVWVSRAAVMFVALIALFIARNPNSSVFDLVAYAWAGFGASFGPVILASLFWRRTTTAGAIAGMVIGSVTTIIWKQCEISPLYEIIPGFIAGSIAIIVVSLLTKNNDATVEIDFHRVMLHYKNNGHRDWCHLEDGNTETNKEDI